MYKLMFIKSKSCFFPNMKIFDKFKFTNQKLIPTIYKEKFLILKNQRKEKEKTKQIIY